MTVVSSREFVADQEKYFDMAENEDIFVERKEKMFLVTIANNGKKRYLEPDDDFHKMMTVEDILERGVGGYADPSEYDEILEPDEDFYNAISMDELRERTHEVIHNFFANI